MSQRNLVSKYQPIILTTAASLLTAIVTALAAGHSWAAFVIASVTIAIVVEAAVAWSSIVLIIELTQCARTKLQHFTYPTQARPESDRPRQCHCDMQAPVIQRRNRSR